jgi:2-polyprenyl-3-methyl-5-hydroxy-6-metoxy-1,4-benzoquinol methylase
MAFFVSLSQRNKQPELMDQPDLAAAAHNHALHALARINWLSGSARILWPALRRLAEEKRGQPLRVLDIATGGGDVPICLHQRAQRTGLVVQFSGVDVSPTAIDHARQRAEQAGAAVTFFTHDALRGSLPDDYDVIMSSLFLHHLERDQAIDLLRRMGQATRSMVLINDLIRSRSGYCLAWLGARVLTRSHVVHVDGPRSVAGAFTISEACQLADAAGLHGAGASWRWPFRFLLQWRRRA